MTEQSKYRPHASAGHERPFPGWGAGGALPAEKRRRWMGVTGRRRRVAALSVFQPSAPWAPLGKPPLPPACGDQGSLSMVPRARAPSPLSPCGGRAPGPRDAVWLALADGGKCSRPTTSEQKLLVDGSGRLASCSSLCLRNGLTLVCTHTHTHTHAHTHRPPEAQREPSREHCHVAQTTSHFVSDVPVTTPGAACALSVVKGSPGSLGIRGGGLMMSALTLNRTGRVRGRSDSSCSDPATRDVLVSSGHRHE